MSRDLRLYFAAVVFVSLGVFVHVVLFNLYLADLSLREDAMGRQLALMTAGTALAMIPASWAARRFGLKRTIAVSVCGLSVALAARSHMQGMALGAASFAAGAFLAGWFLTNAPAVAALAGLGESARRNGEQTSPFSINIALSIAVGALGGLAGARLPGWMPAASPVDAKRQALLVAAALVAVGLVPLLRVRFPRDVATSFGWRSRPEVLRRSPSRAFLLRYLAAVAPWYAFSAGFLPFLNVFLRNRFNASLGEIGGVFAASQVVQAGAVLLAVPLAAGVGVARSVICAQVLAAGTLFALWPAGSLRTAAIVYMIYIGFQVMSEPGLQTILMSRLSAGDRTAASGANLLLMFAVQAGMGALAGRTVVAHGYGAWFVILALLGLAAAGLFAALFARKPPGETGPVSSADGNSRVRQESGATSDPHRPEPG